MENVFISTDLHHKLILEVEEGPDIAEGGRGQGNNLYPLLMQQNVGRDSWDKGTRNEKYRYSDIRRTPHARCVFTVCFIFLRVKGFITTRQVWNNGEAVYSLCLI